jgi:hypothetical protein
LEKLIMNNVPVQSLEKGYDPAASMAPFTEAELWRFFHESPHSTSKHLLTLYSLAIGTHAQNIVDLGLGATTRALRLAATKTGGFVSSCDLTSGDTRIYSRKKINIGDCSWVRAISSCPRCPAHSIWCCTTRLTIIIK